LRRTVAQPSSLSPFQAQTYGINLRLIMEAPLRCAVDIAEALSKGVMLAHIAGGRTRLVQVLRLGGGARVERRTLLLRRRRGGGGGERGRGRTMVEGGSSGMRQLHAVQELRIEGPAPTRAVVEASWSGGGTGEMTPRVVIPGARAVRSDAVARRLTTRCTRRRRRHDDGDWDAGMAIDGRVTATVAEQKTVERIGGDGFDREWRERWARGALSSRSRRRSALPFPLHVFFVSSPLVTGPLAQPRPLQPDRPVPIIHGRLILR
jgi:hypothetical protein